MPDRSADLLIIGAGIVGLATALEAVTRFPELRLIVLEKGRIVEQGLHADLVDKKDGVYAKLHKTQMEMSNLVAIR